MALISGHILCFLDVSLLFRVVCGRYLLCFPTTEANLSRFNQKYHDVAVVGGCRNISCSCHVVMGDISCLEMVPQSAYSKTERTILQKCRVLVQCRGTSALQPAKCITNPYLKVLPCQMLFVTPHVSMSVNGCVSNGTVHGVNLLAKFLSSVYCTPCLTWRCRPCDSCFTKKPANIQM